MIRALLPLLFAAAVLAVCTGAGVGLAGLLPLLAPGLNLALGAIGAAVLVGVVGGVAVRMYAARTDRIVARAQLTAAQNRERVLWMLAETPPAHRPRGWLEAQAAEYADAVYEWRQ